MNTSENVKIVQNFFEAFQKGDVDVIDRFFSPEIEYLVNSTLSDETTKAIPWNGMHKGKKEVKAFIARLLASVDVVNFEVKDYIAQDDKVAVFGTFVYSAKSTGKLMKTEWAIKITMRDGLIYRYHFFEDTYAIAFAFRHSGSWEIENDGLCRIVP